VLCVRGCVSVCVCVVRACVCVCVCVMCICVCVDSKADAAALAKAIQRPGGVYIPPFKMARLRKHMSQDKMSEAYQRVQWDSLRKSINGLLNKVCVCVCSLHLLSRALGLLC